MKFALVGGDRRSALLGAMLDGDGHRVSCFALEKAVMPPSVSRAGCLQSCVYGADCVVLPVPAESGALLNTPLSDNVLPMPELISALWPEQLLCGGKFGDESCALAARRELTVVDMLRRSDFAAGNAALTAEAALGLMMAESERTLQGSRVLVCGWGRIGKLLTVKLRALGAEVTVAARSAEDRAMAAALGCGAVDHGRLEGEIGNFDMVVNTVPARVITDPMLCMMADGAMVMELASPPGGFDRRLAENIGLRVIHAPGLPGKCVPLSAAALMKETLYRIIREQEERE